MNTLSPKEVYNRYYKNARKELGQNFIFDENINRKIVHSTDVSGKIVMEVGPGPGGLTLEILRSNVKKLYVVEYDSHWCDVWRSLSPLFQDKLEVIQSDALKFDINQIQPNIVISNLPYNISTKLLYKWFPDFSKLDELILMFQKEVADRIIAKEKTKDYGQLSVVAQWLADISKVCDLSPNVFSPPPKVYSSVLKFKPYKNVQYLEKYNDFVGFLSKAFSQRRKVMRKNVPCEIMQTLYSMGYPETSRAEEVSVDDYVKLIDKL